MNLTLENIHIIGSVLLGLKKNIRATLELESGSNDPMAYFLTIAAMGVMLSENHSASLIHQAGNYWQRGGPAFRKT